MKFLDIASFFACITLVVLLGGFILTQVLVYVLTSFDHKRWFPRLYKNQDELRRDTKGVLSGLPTRTVETKKESDNRNR